MHHILLVDDDSQMLNSMARLLARQKDRLCLHLASSAHEALGVLKKQDIDLIVSDLLMPEKSGLELIAEVKADPRYQNIPVIMITAQMDNPAKLNALQAGALELLGKPFDNAEFSARIENCLQLKAYQDQILAQKKELQAEIDYRVRYAQLVSDISKALAAEEQLKNLLQRCAQAIVDHLEAAFARIWVFDNRQSRLELMASAGIYTHIIGNHQYIPVGKFKIGRIARDKTPHLTNAVIGDPEIRDQEWAKSEKMQAFVGHPLVAKGRLAGVMAMFSRTRQNQSVLTALASIADGIALGIVQKRSDDQAHFYSFYDALTQLPNRKFFFVFLGKMVARVDRYRGRFALLLIDVDNFNRINESLGHAVGDRCLKVISQRLLALVRDSDCFARMERDAPPAARLGGDEFAVLLQDTDDIHQVHPVVARLLAELSQGIPIQGRELMLSYSIGISMYPGDGNSILDLFKNAETALYHAKHRGKNRFSFYSQSMNQRSLEVLDLEMDLRQAMEKNEFRLYYQPKIDLKTHGLAGAEALIRWQREEGDLIPPDRFIPLAEKTGLILPIGDWVIESACNQIVSWQKTGPNKTPIAVNVSGQQFGQKDFGEKIIRRIQGLGFAPELLELEITETAVMSNSETAIKVLKELKAFGLKISLDDFGTGYSSLGYLQKLPIDQLKIDQSFIRNMLSNSNDFTLVKTIIAMAHNLGLEVIAEGVEEIHQLETLVTEGCDMVQGYLFSPPVPAAKFSDFLNRTFTFG